MREDNDSVLIDSIVKTTVIVFAAVGVLAIGDPIIHPGHVVALYVQKLLLFSVGIGVALALHMKSTRLYPRSFGLLFFAATAVSCAVQGAITGDAMTPAPLLMSIATGTACLLPWGARPQVGVAAISAVALVGNNYAVTGTVVGAIGAPLFNTALATFAASIYLAHFLDRQRRKWRAEGIQLATVARDSEGRFGGVNDGLWDWSIETSEMYYSTRWKEIVGLAPNELSPRLDEWRRRIHPDDVRAFEADLLACMDDRRPQFANEHRLLRPDGSYCWVLARGTGSRNEVGKVVRVAGSLTDISERKRIEAALNESERKYRDIIETLTDVVFALDVEGRCTYLSPVIEAMIGYTVDELLHRSVFELVHPDEASQVIGAFHRALDGQAQPAGEFRMRAKSGAWIWVRCHGRRFEVEGNVAGLRGTFTDVTDRKRAERDRTAVLEVARDIGGTLDVDEILDRLHRRVASALPCDFAFTFRWDPTRNAFTAAGQHGCPTEAVAEFSAFAFANDHPIVQRIGGEGTVVVDDIRAQPWIAVEQLERLGCVALIATPLRVRGRAYGAFCAALLAPSARRFQPRDVQMFEAMTRPVAMAMEAADLFAELQTANQVKEHFVATLTHELRNPINAISGYHSLLLEDGDDLSDDQRRLLERAERCTMELNSLIVATLDLSRFQTARVAIDWQELSVCDLLAELSREIPPPPDKPALRLSWNPAPDVGTLYTDPLKLKMALRNLVTNAVKFTEQGDVHVEARSQDGGVEFRVTDTGIGIPAKALPALFKPFAQAHGIESRRRGGAGLGLHLVKRLVEILGGTVDVQSQVGRGSTFCIWLPRDGSLTPEHTRTDPSHGTQAAA